MTAQRRVAGRPALVEDHLTTTVPSVARLLLTYARRRKAWRDLTYQQFNVLEIVGTQPVSQADIARRLVVTAPVVTRIVSGLADLGLVARRTDASDRRRIRVALTPKGRRRVAAMRRDLMNAAREMLAPLDDGQRARVAESLPGLALLLPEAVAGEPTPRRSAP